MVLAQKMKLTTLSFLFIMIGPGLVGMAESFTCFSSNADEVPPFMAKGVDPNMLLMFDNSASMYDPAYPGGKLVPRGTVGGVTQYSLEPATCYDESYGFDPAQKYVGYFQRQDWYEYDLNAGRFKKFEGDPQAACNQLNFIGTDVCLGYGGNPAVFKNLLGKGNFLNWVASSKMDVAKEVLTGGKHDGINLISESRGCLAKRMTRQVKVKPVGGTTDHYLVLAVRPVQSTTWKSGEKYTAGDVVRALGGWYRARATGISTVSPPENPAAWTPIDYISYIEVFAPSTSKFDISDCELAAEEMAKGDQANQGYIKQKIASCFEHKGNDSNLQSKLSVYNQTLQDCWYAAKQQTWDGYNQGSLSRVLNSCEKLYKGGWDPHVKDPSDPAYACYGSGSLGSNNKWLIGNGYVGTCWDKEANTWTNSANPAYDALPGGCVIEGLIRYCSDMKVPEVVDPSDQYSDTTEYLNLPSSLVDSAVLLQQGEPVATLRSIIHAPTAPSGIIHRYVDKIRMGVMIFNDNGAAEECPPDSTNNNVLFDCKMAGNRDGGKVIAPVKDWRNDPGGLARTINKINATTWTPLAEALFTGIGYYTQNPAFKLHDADFTSGVSPITNWCQSNNVLVITEGGSTADLRSHVRQKAAELTDTTNDLECGLSGSSYFDNMAEIANSYWLPQDEGINRNILTHIVVAGAMRDTGARTECNPKTLLTQAAEKGGTGAPYEAADPEQLATALEKAFESIRSGVASGSAASVISASRGGEGAVYQAVFWSELPGPNQTRAKWLGEVHGLFVNNYGHMFEDTDGGGKLDSADKRVIFYYDQGLKRSRACYDLLDADLNCPAGKSVELSSVKYIWSAAGWLAGIDEEELKRNRGDNNYIYDPRNPGAKSRYIFTWNDLNNNGIVDQGETMPFEAGRWEGLSVSGSRGSVIKDFNVNTAGEVDTIVNWVRGIDGNLRSRKVEIDDPDNEGQKKTVTWRLGDVIHSTPTVVTRPAEGYQFLYKDASYAGFAHHYSNRRHVVYYGANDGMLHAANGGFYHEGGLCRSPRCANEDGAPELGAELWAYVPYNLLPHLKCLTDPGYGHKYFVDQVPRIFDVKLWDNDDPIHKNGWGTILVAGMRFGGSNMKARNLNGSASDAREFVSAYFILDITDPEKPPVLLGEMTYSSGANCEGAACANMGYTTPMPTMVIMKPSGTDTNEWYLVLGSGPTALDGTSTQNGKVTAVNLKNLLNKTAPFRIPDVAPGGSTADRGVFNLAEADSFLSDLMTVDFDLNFMSDAVYFGTVSGRTVPTSTANSSRGKLYRLVTYEQDGTSRLQLPTSPADWTRLPATDPDQTNPHVLLDVNKPISAMPSVGWDGYNFWIYAGTGRYFHRNERTDDSVQAFYAIKEPMVCSGHPKQNVADFTWATVKNQDTTTALHNGTPGDQGLLRVDQIRVLGATSALDATLSCVDGTLNCLPPEVTNMEELDKYIVGERCDTLNTVPIEEVESGTDGWYRIFTDPRERNLGQATLLGGLLTFTTYQPFDDVCMTEGLANLYGVYYRTGTAWYKPVFRNSRYGSIQEDRVELGRGMVTTPNLHVGKQEGATAFVQTSSGAIEIISQENLPLSNSKTGKVSWQER
jgi:type IV pilus assembly protein PilY1